jgi:hypothetical protein
MLLILIRSETVFSKPIAVRYIGGILELPTFWVGINYKYQGAVVKNLCKRVHCLIQDIDIDSLDGLDVNKKISLDTEGIDMLADAILAGTHGWIRRPFAGDLVAESWLHPLIELIRQLRWHVLFS